MGGQRLVLLSLGVLVLLVGLGYCFITRNFEFLYYISTLVVIGAGIFLLDRRVTLPLPLLWGLFLWLALHLAGGAVPVPKEMVDTGMDNYTLYNVRPVSWLPRYDQWVHAFGFFLSSLCGWRALFIGSGRSLRPTFGPRVAAGLIGMGCGATNEVIEFIATQIMPHTNVGGYVNTGWDLVSNMTGCVIAMLLIRVFHDRWFAFPGPADQPQRA